MRQIAKSILLRLTAEEYAHLKATADAAGLKLEPMLRQLILGVELRPRPPDEYTALLRGAVRHWQQCESDRLLGQCQEICLQL